MFTTSQIGANIGGLDPEWLQGWEVAPKPIAEALKAARDATIAVSDTNAAVQDAQIVRTQAQLEWDALAVEAARNDAPMPDREASERATFKLIAAEQDAAKAQQNQLKTEIELGAALDDEGNRDAFLAALQKQLTKDQNELQAIAPKVIALVTRINQMTATSTFLGVWPHYSRPEIDERNLIGRAIDESVNAKLWVKPQPEPGAQTTR